MRKVEQREGLGKIALKEQADQSITAEMEETIQT